MAPWSRSWPRSSGSNGCPHDASLLVLSDKVKTMTDPRLLHRYTPYFCEENVWWLARELCGQDGGDAGAWVCLFSNASASIAVANQRAAATGEVMGWDYHVVLAVPRAGAFEVYDLDSRLPFPIAWPAYFEATFPGQRRLPARWRSRMRQIPVTSYLERFCSDRSHMLGKVASSQFPPYPPICPPDPAAAVTLSAYRDLARPVGDGSLVADVAAVTGGPLAGS